MQVTVLATYNEKSNIGYSTEAFFFVVDIFWCRRESFYINETCKRCVKNSMSAARIITINIISFLALLSVLILFPPTVFRAVLGITKIETQNVASLTEEQRYARELANLRSTYHDFIIWRSGDYAGREINVEGGLRRTFEPEKLAEDATEYWFFGGSTTWGYGVSDRSTYPSKFAAENGAITKNFGELGYISRQSLEYLINLLLLRDEYSDLTNIHVVFYDGANDVAQRCISQVSELGSAREWQIRKAVAQSYSPTNQWTFERTFAQVSDMLKRILARLDVQTDNQRTASYDCASNPQEAAQIANTLTNVWHMASQIVTSRGGRFTAILQPVAFVGTPGTAGLQLHTPRNLSLDKQFDAVYPRIEHQANQSDFEFLDFRSVYDECDDCYLDFCHATPEGHVLLVEALSSGLSQSKK